MATHAQDLEAVTERNQILNPAPRILKENKVPTDKGIKCKDMPCLCSYSHCQLDASKGTLPFAWLARLQPGPDQTPSKVNTIIWVSQGNKPFGKPSLGASQCSFFFFFFQFGACDPQASPQTEKRFRDMWPVPTSEHNGCQVHRKVLQTPRISPFLGSWKYLHTQKPTPVSYQKHFLFQGQGPRRLFSTRRVSHPWPLLPRGRHCG